MEDPYIEHIVAELRSRIKTQRQALELTYQQKDVTMEEQVQTRSQWGETTVGME